MISAKFETFENISGDDEKRILGFSYCDGGNILIECDGDIPFGILISFDDLENITSRLKEEKERF